YIDTVAVKISPTSISVSVNEPNYFMSTIRFQIHISKVQMKAISALFDFPNLNLDSYERLGRRYNPPPPPQPATLSNIGCSYDSSGPRIASGRRLNGYVGCNPVNPSSTNNNSSKSSDWFPYGGGTNRNPQNFKSRFGSPVCPNSSSTSNNRNGGVSYNRFGYARPISTNGGSKRASKTAKVLRSSFFQTPKLSLGCHVRLGESGDPSVVYVTNDGDKNKSI
ncbi:unnamed protein product, partial [Allacma fusca]